MKPFNASGSPELSKGIAVEVISNFLKAVQASTGPAPIGARGNGLLFEGEDSRAGSVWAPDPTRRKRGSIFFPNFHRRCWQHKKTSPKCDRLCRIKICWTLSIGTGKRETTSRNSQASRNRMVEKCREKLRSRTICIRAFFFPNFNSHPREVWYNKQSWYIPFYLSKSRVIFSFLTREFWREFCWSPPPARALPLM